VFKKGNIIRCGFYPQDDTEFIVEFYPGGSHDVLNASAFNAGIESVAHTF
jgi:tripartite-type tricarboxylate transporter receptor subunit TctC